MYIKITQIEILRMGGADRIFLQTELPEGCYPFKGIAHLRLDVASGNAEEYCKKNFPNVVVMLITNNGPQGRVL